MNSNNLLDEAMYESTVLRQAAEKLNFIWRLAYAYQTPELLRFLDDLTEELLERREFLRNSLEALRKRYGRSRGPLAALRSVNASRRPAVAARIARIVTGSRVPTAWMTASDRS